MPMQLDPNTFAQLGGLGAFVMVVWWELRQQRQERSEDAKQLREILTKQGEEISALLEYVRLSRAEYEATPREMQARRARSRPHGVPVAKASDGDDDE